MAEPPSLVGAVHVTAAEPLAAVALTLVGASGTVLGVTGDEGVEGALLPAPLVAVTVYAVTGEPPSEAGGVQVTTADALPAVAVTPVGASGTVIGVTGDEGVDGVLSPAALLAMTVKL